MTAKKPINKQILDKILRIFLRTIPVLPGPELYDMLNEVKSSRSELDQKVEKAATSLNEASHLVSELEETLSERMEKVNKLRDEYSKYSELAEIEEKKAEALIKQIQTTVHQGKNRERLLALVINVFAGIIVFILDLSCGTYT